MHRTITLDALNMTSGCGIYAKYPDISDREHWEYLSDELKSNLIKAGEEAQNEPWTQLLISDFREFSKTGNRVQFEDKYFPRRRKLNKLIMAECVQNEGKFLDDILDGLYLILEETTWCLPPHTSYVRDAKQETMPDVTRPIIDLFDAESGAEVAFAEYLLRPVLKKVSPYISTYVNERLKERIFEPYLHQHFWWMGNGKEAMCNWTVWCTQNVLLCALTREADFFTEDERRLFLEKAALSCDYFLDEYGDDGGCDEGAGYYSHAGLCLFGCLEIMSGALEVEKTGHEALYENSFDRVFRNDLIRNVANYIVKMHVGGGYYVNFADCSALPGRRTAREFLFGKACSDDVLASFAAADFRAENLDEKLISEEINLFYHVLQAFSFDEMMKYPEAKNPPEDSFFESVGLMVARDKVYTLAAKAGDNADSHNHNDVGSFTLYKEGKPFIIDLGVGTYTKKTFSDRRYEIWTMQSQYHNLPTFSDGDELVMEHDGEKFAARDVNCILCMNGTGGGCEDRDVLSAGTNDIESNGHASGTGTDGRELVGTGSKHVSSLAMDIAGAYDDARIRSYNRVVSLYKGAGVEVVDDYDGDLPFMISLMTYEKPELIEDSKKNGASCLIKNGDVYNSEAHVSINGYDAGRLEAHKSSELLLSVGSIGSVRICGACGVRIETCPINDERLAIAWKHDVYRILIDCGNSHNVRMWFE